jgi:hypothetical protein
MNWESLDWAALERLRGKFLQGAAAAGPYWESPADLASYDFTYGERIGWKWDHVFRELRLRQWRPRSRTVLDWGCGSGIASRRVIEWLGLEQVDSLTLWDHAPAAGEFAAAAAERAFPSLRVHQATPGFLAATEPLGLLIVSHVLNELPPAALAELRTLLGRAEEVLWVEPGTHRVSRQLGALRDDLRGTFQLVAPCTHGNACPMFAAENERHWCHFFAPPPSEIFADPYWVKFGQRAGIDLRSLPYCFLALDRLTPVAATVYDRRNEDAACADGGHRPPLQDEPLSRVIGRVEHFKPYARLLNCDAAGLAELELPKRADPALFKQLDRTKAPLVYRWRRDGDKIRGGEAVG